MQNIFFLGIFGPEDGKLVKIFDKEFEDLAPLTLLYQNTCNPDDYRKIAKEIRQYYLKNEKIDYSKKKELTDVQFFLF